MRQVMLIGDYKIVDTTGPMVLIKKKVILTLCRLKKLNAQGQKRLYLHNKNGLDMFNCVGINCSVFFSFNTVILFINY